MTPATTSFSSIAGSGNEVWEAGFYAYCFSPTPYVHRRTTGLVFPRLSLTPGRMGTSGALPGNPENPDFARILA